MRNIKLYEPMIKSIIKKYLSYADKVGLSYDDLFQEASIAVLQAENTYKNNKNMKLETWIYNNVEWQLQRALKKNSKYKDITSLQTVLNSSEDDNMTLEDTLQDDNVNIQEEIEDKLMIQTYKNEIIRCLDLKKADVMILKYFECMPNNYIEKVLNITGVSNYIRESRMTLIRKSLLFRNEYRRIHHIDDYSNTERLALI